MRKASLDVCRVLACMAVVLGHTGMLFWEFDPSSPTWAVYNLLFMLMVFLASEASDFVNGHILYVDGGILAYIGKQP